MENSQPPKLMPINITVNFWKRKPKQNKQTKNSHKDSLYIREITVNNGFLIKNHGPQKEVQ